MSNQDSGKKKCPIQKNGCVFLPIWKKVNIAISDIYDNVTFKDLLESGEAL
ncbi:MAG: hypothetical protein V1872_03885 [bacterium]